MGRINYIQRLDILYMTHVFGAPDTSWRKVVMAAWQFGLYVVHCIM